MKKVPGLILTSLMVIALLVSCGETAKQQTKTDTAVADSTKDIKVKSGSDDGDNLAINAINRQVKDFAIDGFPGDSAKLSKSEDLENMKKIVKLVKPIIESVPDGYVMQITGHAANQNTKARQKSVSVSRASKIYEELKKSGVPAKKMSYKGVGAEDPDSRYSDKDAKQRRVSFKAVKK